MDNGNVVLQQTGARQTVTVGFYQLIPADREIVRNALRARGQENLIPTAGESRTWTDSRGQSLSGQFLGVVNQNVVLLTNDKPASFPFGQFSAADQEYVRGQLDSRGEGHLVPRVPIAGSEPQSGDVLTGRTPQPNPNFPAANPKPAAIAIPQPAAPSTDFDALSGNRPAVPAAPVPSFPRPSPVSPGTGIAPPGYRPATQSGDVLNPSRPADRIARYEHLRVPSARMMQGVYCPNCKREFLGLYKEGDPCPHCIKNERSTAYRAGRWTGLGLIASLVGFGLRRLFSK
jgi:hypothetical protein